MFREWTCCWFEMAFIRQLLDTAKSNTSFLTHYRSFLAHHFDVTSISLTSRIEHQEVLTFAYRSLKKCMWIVIIFVTECLYICGVIFWRRVVTPLLKKLTKKKKKKEEEEEGNHREKVWSIGFYVSLFTKLITISDCLVKLTVRWKSNASDKSWLKQHPTTLYV